MTIESFYNKSELDNGIRVLTEKIPYVRSVSIGIWILAGTIDETVQKKGIAHFVEHLLFKGTETRSSLEIADALESLGGYLNAFTSKEQTCYYAHILDENIDTAVDILSDLILHPRLAADDVEKEKQVVIEEINEMEDSPDELVHEYFVKALYQPHPISFSTLGEKQTVKSFSREDIIRFMKSNYTGNRVVVAAAGNLDHENVVELVAQYLSYLPAASKRKDRVLPAEKPRVISYEENIQQAHLCLGRRCFSYVDSRKYALLLLNTILGMGMSSRLFQNIREKYGLAYSIYSFTELLKDTGVFGVYLGTDSEHLQLAQDLVRKELNLLITDNVTDEELNKRKNQLKGSLLLGLESTSNRMNRLAKTEIYHGEFFSIENIITSINRVNQEQIAEIAASLFANGQLSVVTITPSNNQKK